MLYVRPLQQLVDFTSGAEIGCICVESEDFRSSILIKLDLSRRWFHSGELDLQTMQEGPPVRRAFLSLGEVATG